MDEEGLRGALLRRPGLDTPRRTLDDVPSEELTLEERLEVLADVPRPKTARGRRARAVFVRMSDDELLTVRRVKRPKESWAECLRRLALEAAGWDSRH